MSSEVENREEGISEIDMAILRIKVNGANIGVKL
jgi:hypothetical protein